MEEFDNFNEEHGSEGVDSPIEQPSTNNVLTQEETPVPFASEEVSPGIAMDDTIDSVVGVSETDLGTVLDKPVDSSSNESAEDKASEEKDLRKVCPTRHGCQGATDCDYSYGSYPF